MASNHPPPIITTLRWSCSTWSSLNCGARSESLKEASIVLTQMGVRGFLCLLLYFEHSVLSSASTSTGQGSAPSVTNSCTRECLCMYSQNKKTPCTISLSARPKETTSKETALPNKNIIHVDNFLVRVSVIP